MDNPWIQDNLTAKQEEYIAMLASGESTISISEKNFVSHHTVRNTITKAKERVGANSTYNLISMAITRKWIVPHDSSQLPIQYIPNE